MSQFDLILASSSQTRQQLMNRLGLPYQCISPNIDESSQNETHADDLAKRLAFEKAQCIAKQHPHAVVIGSDQVAWRINQPHEFIGKPLTTHNAIAQLQQSAGQTVCFSTGLSIQQHASGFEKTIVEHYQVKFRQLNLDEIQRYVEKEQPLHCAGSFMCEGLGISLFESMSGNDQTTLMGLPMIQVCNILRALNIRIP
ncbi:Maf family protein [Acinetobacter sp. MD2(2019)]|uniref:Maf family protein n=1 Tax=Acinetobacter sp. MD2(2019) TaxID=2605273 RepID=UPI002D1EAA4F|nr:Maf family protein [Acinetobacter sp. MD2(2019)]MEB3752749.1 septum formation protein Maf [Acinetobacter sp. MD2(2019)]